MRLKYYTEVLHILPGGNWDCDGEQVVNKKTDLHVPSFDSTYCFTTRSPSGDGTQSEAATVSLR